MPKHVFNINKLRGEPVCSRASSAEIHLIDNKAAVVDGAKCVVEYTPCCVKLSLGDKLLCFAGDDLMIRTLSGDKIIVEGSIATVDFSS